MTTDPATPERPLAAVPSVQTALGDAGACPEIVWRGRVWKLGHPTQRAKAALEELGAAKALTEVRALRDVLDPAAYADEKRAVDEAVRSGAYRTFNSGWTAVVNGEGTRHLFVLALFRERHPSMTEDECLGILAECPDEVLAGVARVAPDFFRLILADPRIPPAARAAAEPMLSAVRESILAGVAATRTPAPPTPAPPTPAPPAPTVVTSSGCDSSTPIG